MHAITSRYPQVRSIRAQQRKLCSKPKDFCRSILHKCMHMHTCREGTYACTCMFPTCTYAPCAGAPQVRYVVANMDGSPAWVLMWIKWLLPERAWDALILANL